MEEKRVYELLGKKLSGEAQDHELQELNALLEKFPQALYTLETMEHYWQSGNGTADRLQREAALERHLQRLAAVKQPAEETAEVVTMARRPRTIMIWASTLAAAVFLGCILLLPIVKKTPELAAATSNRQQLLQLPDGSTVRLNALTTIHYTQRQDGARIVNLEGEAYFNVKRDPAHPFFVHTTHMDIRDLGTSFNVKAYPGDKTAEATLIQGSIDVRLNKGKGGAVLSQPHQKFTAYTQTSPAAPGSATAANRGPDASEHPAAITYQVSNAIASPTDSLLAETAWMKNMLVFRSEAFGDLAARLERWYAVSIHFTDTAPAHYRFTGVLANENLNQALQELQMMKQFHFTITGKSVTIKQ